MDRNESHTLCDISVLPPDERAQRAAIDHWNNVAKPIGSLGLLEEAVVKIAALTANEDVCLDKRAVVAMCADNGVVAEGVTQTGQEVTAAVAANMARNASSVCRMGSVAGVDVFPVDIGMVGDKLDGVIDRRVSDGTDNIACGPAMTRQQALQAVGAGMDLVAELKEQGYRIIVTGEMGIGNTTTSSALASVLLGLSVEEVTGRGAGLDSAGLDRKVDTIKRAIALNKPDPDDVLDVLAKLGGYDIAGLVGLFIGAALQRVPIVVDGLISAIAAYVAVRLVPGCECAMLASHVSAEPAARLILEKLGLKPIIYAGMRLGEGTGAVCLLPLLDMALALYEGTSFAGLGIDAYEVDLV